MADQVIYSFHAILESIRSGIANNKTARLLVTSKPGPRVKECIEAARLARITCTSVTDQELTRLDPSGKHRGALLRILDSNTIGSANPTKAAVTQVSAAQNPLFAADSWEEALSQQVRTGADGAKRAIVLALDGITDPHNFGAILRCADAFGVRQVLLPERRSAADTDVVLRTSAGARAWIRVDRIVNLNRVIERAKECGYWVLGADMGGVSISQARLPQQPILLVLGREGEGMHDLVKKNCDQIVSIPMLGHVDSLNVSVASGILLYALRNT